MTIQESIARYVENLLTVALGLKKGYKIEVIFHVVAISPFRGSWYRLIVTLYDSSNVYIVFRGDYNVDDELNTMILAVANAFSTHPNWSNFQWIK
jgi:hypothetical protein